VGLDPDRQSGYDALIICGFAAALIATAVYMCYFGRISYCGFTKMGPPAKKGDVLQGSGGGRGDCLGVLRHRSKMAPTPFEILDLLQFGVLMGCQDGPAGPISESRESARDPFANVAHAHHLERCCECVQVHVCGPRHTAHP